MFSTTYSGYPLLRRQDLVAALYARTRMDSHGRMRRRYRDSAQSSLQRFCQEPPRCHNSRPTRPKAIRRLYMS